MIFTLHDFIHGINFQLDHNIKKENSYLVVISLIKHHMWLVMYER